MTTTSRRTFLAGGVAAAATGVLPGGASAATEPARTTAPTDVPADDLRYGDLVVGNNARWVGTPQVVRIANHAADVERVVGEAVAADKKIGVRSGGHCYEDFATGGAQVLLDLSRLDDVRHDPALGAFVIEPGVRLLSAYERLFTGWGVTIPGGTCHSVGAGGHIAGGGYGLLSRAFGLTVDHLHGVEVVVVDGAGRARTVLATREHNTDLWWAHTGGGGGNFGVVTKYLMRSPGIRSTSPGDHLPKPPATVVVTTLGFPWEHLDLATFTRLVRNFSGWHERNNSPSTNRLSANLLLRSAASGAAGMVVQVDAAATDVLNGFLADIREDLGFTPLVIESRTLPWLHATRYLGTNTPFLTDPTARAEHKAAYLRRMWDETQIAAVHHHLSNPPANNPNAMVVLLGFGGQVNTVRPADTAVAQRDSVLKALFQAFWADETDDDAHLKWMRDLYRDVHATTGGVPVPGPTVDGCYINYPDVDLNDPTFNTSGVPWHDLYYKENYPRLQQVKGRWDPLNVFHHTQSIRLPGH